MSLFLGGSGRLTRGRLALALGACLVLAALATLVAPLVGIDMTRTGRHLSILSLGDLSDTDRTIFVYGRLPRALGALVVGAALAGAGCTFQAILRNPLAEPFTLGISSGASLGAVIAIRFGIGSFLGGTGEGAAAITGAGVAVAAVWMLGRVGRSLPPATILLAGVTFSMWCAAASMLLQYTADFTETSHVVHWMMGDLKVVRWETLERAGPAIAIGLAVLVARARDLNALAAGPEAAAAVGVAVGRAQTIAFVASSLLVGAAISIAGPIGFVGLMVPHALRTIVGPDHRVLLPASILCGGTLLIVCDTIARLVLDPDQLPVGILTAFLGAPFLLLLLVQAKRSASLWGRP